MKLGIVGAGAAGLFASVIAGRLGADVILLERGAGPGKKLAMTGSGKGNYTNAALSADKYPCCDRSFIETALARFGYYDTLDLFESVGIYPRIRNGYAYPRSERADALVGALVGEAEKSGARIECNTFVSAIDKSKDGFVVKTDKKEYSFDRLLICSGGMAAPKTGSDGSMSSAIRALGHKIRECRPSLAGFITDHDNCFKKASGVRTQARLKLFTDGKYVSESEGELQITDRGLSGIPVLQLSHFYAASDAKEAELEIDFLPEYSYSEAKRAVGDGSFTDGLVPYKLLNLFSRNTSELVGQLTSYRVKIIGTRDFEDAQVTSGGVLVSEICSDTMESRLIDGLYFAGEVMDVDGLCGGYNLQWAWTSASIAAYSALGKTYNGFDEDKEIEKMSRWARAEVSDRRK